MAAICFLAFILNLAAVPAQPKHATSLSDSKKRQSKISNLIFSFDKIFVGAIGANTNTKETGVSESFWRQLYSLLTTAKWVPIAISSGMGTGVQIAMMSLISQILKPTFEDQSVS